MPDAQYDPDDYDWHSPKDVVIVHDREFDVLAYGVPKHRVVGKVVNPPDDAAESLPKPPHTSVRSGSDSCLACEWIDLMRRIDDAS